MMESLPCFDGYEAYLHALFMTASFLILYAWRGIFGALVGILEHIFMIVLNAYIYLTYKLSCKGLRTSQLRFQLLMSRK
jgi:hypothetical protein